MEVKRLFLPFHWLHFKSPECEVMANVDKLQPRLVEHVMWDLHTINALHVLHVFL